jgi:L-arabinose transport system substrate-binding protein
VAQLQPVVRLADAGFPLVPRALARPYIAWAWAWPLLGFVALGGCKSGSESRHAPEATAAAPNAKRTIAYIQKQGDQQYFVDEADGARAEAARLGIDLKVSNVALDSNQAVSALEMMIAQRVAGIAIVVPDQRIGPQVIERAKQAGVPLIATDDGIADAANHSAPFVGFDGGAMGREVGLKAGALFKSSGWAPADTRIISSFKQDLSVCQDRVKGAGLAFAEVTGNAPVRLIDLGTDNTVIDAQNRTTALVTANRGVKHWIVWGCNDENVSGVVTALANAGFEPKDVDGVGLGAYLACKDWNGGKQTGMKAALFIDGHDVGAAAVRVLADALHGKEAPAKTIAKTSMVDATNWQKSGVKCL